MHAKSAAHIQAHELTPRSEIMTNHAYHDGDSTRMDFTFRMTGRISRTWPLSVV